MVSTIFVNREEELEYIHTVLASSEFQFIPVWGRRRVGKTRLLNKALSGRGVYFLATESAATDIVRQFRDEAAEQTSDETLRSIEPTWSSLFAYIAKMGIPVVIDEFPYLISSDPTIPSVFQKIIDTTLKGTKTKLFLCGSSVRMMESHVVEYRAPLYGRRTGQIKLNPMKFQSIQHFFPQYSFEDLVRVYGTCGGIPMYLLELDPDRAFWDNLELVFFNPHSILYAEADLLLKEEFKSAMTYRSILGHIAAGKTRLNDIRLSLNAEKSDISPYLNQLASVGFIKREVPADEDPSRSRRGCYRICDNYLNFYFRYVVPGKSLIESGNPRGLVARVKKDMDSYVGRIAEEVVNEAFLRWSGTQGIHWDRVGSWWFGEDEMDILALSADRNEMLCGEVKWSKHPMPPKDIQTLITRSEKVRWGMKNKRIRYLAFSKSGFTPRCESLMEEYNVIYWTPEHISNILTPE